MIDREKIIKGLELCANISPDGCLMLCPYKDEKDETYSGFCEQVLKQDALTLLKECEQRRRLEVHNIGNVDIPDGVTMEQFYAIMDNVAQALIHTDKGESWPYTEAQRDYEASIEMAEYCERYEQTYNPEDGNM